MAIALAKMDSLAANVMNANQMSLVQNVMHVNKITLITHHVKVFPIIFNEKSILSFCFRL